MVSFIKQLKYANLKGYQHFFYLNLDLFESFIVN